MAKHEMKKLKVDDDEKDKSEEGGDICLDYPPIRRVEEFTDDYGLLDPYFIRFPFDDEVEDFDYKNLYGHPCSKKTHQTIVKYINQIRESFLIQGSRKTIPEDGAEGEGEGALKKWKIIIQADGAEGEGASVKTIQAILCRNSHGIYLVEQWRMKPDAQDA